MVPVQIPEVHPVDLARSQDQVVAGPVLAKARHGPSQRFGGSAAPVRVTEGLLGRQQTGEAFIETVEVVGLPEVVMDRSGE